MESHNSYHLGSGLFRFFKIHLSLWWCQISLFLFVLVTLGFELRSLDLQSRCSIAWATPTVHFALVYLFIYLFCSSGVWIQGLHLEPLHQPFLVMGFSEIGSCQLLICPGWFQTLILLISASWVARITGVGHQCPAPLVVWRQGLMNYLPGLSSNQDGPDLCFPVS
jgi:hypothetical protein